MNWDLIWSILAWLLFIWIHATLRGRGWSLMIPEAVLVSVCRDVLFSAQCWPRLAAWLTVQALNLPNGVVSLHTETGSYLSTFKAIKSTISPKWLWNNRAVMNTFLVLSPLTEWLKNTTLIIHLFFSLSRTHRVPPVQAQQICFHSSWSI